MNLKKLKLSLKKTTTHVALVEISTVDYDNKIIFLFNKK